MRHCGPAARQSGYGGRPIDFTSTCLTLRNDNRLAGGGAPEDDGPIHLVTIDWQRGKWSGTRDGEHVSKRQQEPSVLAVPFGKSALLLRTLRVVRDSRNRHRERAGSHRSMEPRAPSHS